MTRSELRERLKRMLGCPMINVEIHDQQLNDSINMAREKYIKYAVGNATQEVYFTIMLKAGKWVYDLPAGVVDVLSYTDKGAHGGVFGVFEPGGINTLFTMDNYMYQVGMINPWKSSMWGIDYQIAMDFIETVNRYNVDTYQFRYHRMTNQLELSPVPDCGNSLTITKPVSGYEQDPETGSYSCPTSATEFESITYDSPGFILLRTYMIEGSSLPTYVPAVSGSSDEDYGSRYDVGERYNEFLFNEPWIIEYSLALTKMNLGLIRRKMQNVALGNAGIQLDGAELYQEGREDKQQLEERLDLEESFEGYGICVG